MFRTIKAVVALATSTLFVLRQLRAYAACFSLDENSCDSLHAALNAAGSNCYSHGCWTSGRTAHCIRAM